MNIRRFIASPVFTLLSALLVAAAAIALQPGTDVVGSYWALAFWTLVGIDFYRTQVVDNGESEVVENGKGGCNHNNYSFADRFIGNLFVAPFIFPARLVRMAALKVAGN